MPQLDRSVILANRVPVLYLLQFFFDIGCHLSVLPDLLQLSD